MNDIFNHFLEKCDLKFTSLKQPRQLYSLRHYAIQTRIRKSQGKKLISIFLQEMPERVLNN